MTASVRRAWLVALLGLLSLTVCGRLAMHAWLLRPAPTGLPEIGATTDAARPFCLVILDGLAEGSAWAGPEGPMPSLRALAARGAWGVALAGDPTLTAPCVRTLLTGRAPDIVTGFRNFDAEPVEGSLIGYLADRGARTAHAGDASAWQLCRDHYRPEDVFAVPDQGPVDQGQTDDRAVPFLLDRIAAGADVVTLHLTRPDHAGHRHGALGGAYAEACRTADGQVRQVVEAFVARHPDALVLVAADHGVSPTGTHGGGEASARRAPFVLAGRGVRRGGPVEVSQMALAPTVAALLGLPQPPLADAPPAPGLLDLPAETVARALDAYVRARLVVARSVVGGEVDPIERRRAQVFLERRVGPQGTAALGALAGEVNRLVDPSSAPEGASALALAALALAALVRLAGGARLAPRLEGAVGALAAVFFALALGVAPAPVGAVGLAALALVVLVATHRDGRVGVVLPVALLASVPVLTAAGLALQSAVERAPEGATGRIALGLGLAGALALLVLRPRALARRFARVATAEPALLAAAGGALLGFTLTLRPFLDPLLRPLHPALDLRALYSLVGVLAVGLAAALARGRPPALRVGVVGLAVLLFLGPRVADVVLERSWLEVVARQDARWLGLGLALVLLLPLAVGLRRLTREDGPGLLLALLALLAAFAVRWDPAPGPWLARGANALGLLALLATLVRGSPDGRLLVRLLAAVALARRLTALDGEMVPFVLLAALAALGARLRAPRTRVGLAALALVLLAVRIAAFHAMGGTESFSTVDVAAGFVGMRAAPVDTLDAAGISGNVIEATLQLTLRFALPWVVLLAAAARLLEGRGGVRTVFADLVLGYAARGATITWALWAWWRSAWWMERAWPVYALGAADVVLLALAALLLGLLGPAGRARARAAPGRPAPSAVARAATAPVP